MITNTKDKKQIHPLAVSIAQAAELLSVSRPTIYELIKREDFHCVFKIGNRQLISVEALQDWISRQIGGNSNG